jgi:hypothetical protein
LGYQVSLEFSLELNFACLANALFSFKDGISFALSTGLLGYNILDAAAHAVAASCVSGPGGGFGAVGSKRQSWAVSGNGGVSFDPFAAAAPAVSVGRSVSSSTIGGGGAAASAQPSVVLSAAAKKKKADDEDDAARGGAKGAKSSSSKKKGK